MYRSPVKTHAAAFCLGVWVMGTVCVSIVAMQNFYTIDRLLEGPSHAAFAAFVEDAGREDARNVLRYLSSELNRLFFQLWNVGQLGLGAAALWLLWDLRSPVAARLRWTLVAMLAVVLVVAFALTGSGTETTEDIDAIINPAEKRLDAASFTPRVSKEVVVEKALGKAADVLGGADTSTLETRATVGLYTGKDSRGDQVTQRKVWLVVVDDLLIVFPSGPAGSSVDLSGQRQQNQLVIFFDASTGEEVDSFVSGRWVSA